MYIESPQNGRVRAWSQLKTKKGRTKQGAFLVEGRRLIEELLRSDYEVEALLWDVSGDEPEVGVLEHQKVQGRVFELSPAAFALVSDTATSQGVIAVAKLPCQLEAGRYSHHAILLDGLADPGNLGTLLRTSEAFSFQTVCAGTDTVDAFAPKVVRATMGGMFRLQIHTLPSDVFIRRWLSQYPKGQVLVTAAEASQPCYACDMTMPTLIVIGNEAFGVSDTVRALATETVSIPMDEATESLNAGVAGSILLYESYRQRLTQEG